MQVSCPLFRVFIVQHQATGTIGTAAARNAQHQHNTPEHQLSARGASVTPRLGARAALTRPPGSQCVKSDPRPRLELTRNRPEPAPRADTADCGWQREFRGRGVAEMSANRSGRCESMSEASQRAASGRPGLNRPTQGTGRRSIDGPSRRENSWERVRMKRRGVAADGRQSQFCGQVKTSRSRRLSSGSARLNDIFGKPRSPRFVCQTKFPLEIDFLVTGRLHGLPTTALAELCCCVTRLD